MRGSSLPFLGLALILTVVYVAGPVLAQQLPAMPGPRTIVAGKSVAGIALSTPIDVVVARFGPPAGVIETDRDTLYVWHRFGVNVYAQGGVVSAVSTSNSLMRAGELGPGFRVEDAVRVFGTAYHRGAVEGFQGLHFDDLGIAFGIDRTSVAVVLVFSPGQAARVSGLQRSAKFAPAAGPIALPSPAAAPAGPMIPVSPVAQVLSGIPFVAGQRAYGSMTNYMSLSGYLRWLVYQSSANWITVSEASRMVKDQKTTVNQQPENGLQDQPATATQQNE